MVNPIGNPIDRHNGHLLPQSAVLRRHDHFHTAKSNDDIVPNDLPAIGMLLTGAPLIPGSDANDLDHNPLWMGRPLWMSTARCSRLGLRSLKRIRRRNEK
jgi:hypothetical protein